MSCKFIRTVDRLLPAWEGCRFLGTELLEERLESSCCSPAFTAAAAWRDVEADRGEGDGV